MSKVFVSYRHVSPDQDLAHFLVHSLEERGHEVFVDRRIPMGTRWYNEIERQLRKQGDTTIVKGPRQMGKSSLLARAVCCTSATSSIICERGYFSSA